MKSKILFHLIWVNLIALPSLAGDALIESPEMVLGLGLLDLNVAKYSTSTTGSTGIVGTVSPTVGLRFDALVFGQAISPMVSYTLLGKKNVDQEKTKSLLVTLPFDFSIGSSGLHLKFGPGVLWRSIAGPSKTSTTKTMPNGSGTAQFYLPDRTSTSRIVIADLGVGTGYEAYRFDLDFLIAGALTSRRTASAAFTVGYSL